MCSQMRLVAHAIVAFGCSPIHVRYVPSFDVALELNHPAIFSFFLLMKYVLSSNLFQSKSTLIFLNDECNVIFPCVKFNVCAIVFDPSFDFENQM